MFEIH